MAVAPKRIKMKSLADWDPRGVRFLTSDRQVISKAPRQQIPHTAPAAISPAPQCAICSGDGICAADQSLRNIKPISSISATHRRENPPFGLRAKRAAHDLKSTSD
jgi:hypothetical protein